MKRTSRSILVVAGVAAGVLAIAFLLSGSAFEDRGPVHVAYPAGEVKEVRVLGIADVRVDGEPKPGFSVLGSIALFMLATASLVTAASLRLAATRRRLVRFG